MHLGDDTLGGANALSAFHFNTERAINLRNGSARAFGLGANLAVSDGIAKTDIHDGGNLVTTILIISIIIVANSSSAAHRKSQTQLKSHPATDLIFSQKEQAPPSEYPSREMFSLRCAR
jgi:hypothetical protein